MIKNLTCKRSFVPNSNTTQPRKPPPPNLPRFVGNPLMQQTRMSQQLQLFLITADADDKGRTYPYIYSPPTPIKPAHPGCLPPLWDPWMTFLPDFPATFGCKYFCSHVFHFILFVYPERETYDFCKLSYKLYKQFLVPLKLNSIKFLLSINFFS